MISHNEAKKEANTFSNETIKVKLTVPSKKK